MKHNNIIQNNHFKKDWQNRVRVWLNQAGKKESRRVARKTKAEAVNPRPLQKLRPVVRCQTFKYNTRQRAGRGFTFDELKEAGINRKSALTLGITVDHRRKNRSMESIQENVQRLKLYRSNLIVFPRKSKKPKSGDSEEAEIKLAQQQLGDIMPVTQRVICSKARVISEEDKKVRVYAAMRLARSDERLVGLRKKRAEKKAAEEAMKKK